MIWTLNNGVLDHGIELGTFSAGWRVPGAGDFTNNGYADLVLENASNGQRLIWLLKNGVYSSSIALPTGSTQWQIVDR